jgi:serine/threonine-protein kinase
VLTANYDIEREIGRGGMGIVYCARDRRLKRAVAIKLLPPELAFRSEIRTRFLREAETAAQLSHPSIVPIHSVDEQEGLVYFVMGFVDGENLARRLHDQGRMSVPDTRRVLREVADALAYAHGRGVIHRDIKPDNILLDAETGRAMVTDFGIARAVTEGDSRLTATGIAIGTPAYMSPEQCAGEREIDGRSDLYSLGIVGYQMLAGDVPFLAMNTPAMLMKHIAERPAPITSRRADVPDDLARTVMLLLEKEPAARFSSAEALAAALDGGPVPQLPSPTARPDHAAGSSGGPSRGMARADGSAYGEGSHAPSQGSWAPGTAATYEPRHTGDYMPTDEEWRRWHAPVVLRLRRLLVYYFACNLVIVFFAIIASFSLLPLTAMWSLYMAFLYAKLWSEGYDWRDVSRQPRHRALIDVASDAIDDTSALFDPKKREQMRQRRRDSRATPQAPRSYLPPLGAPGRQAPPRGGAQPPATAPPRARDDAPPSVRQADMDRNEINRLLESMSRSERAQIPDVAASAAALYQRIESLARTVEDAKRQDTARALETIEHEVHTLEEQANPLDRAASETRVRRLAFLKRQRRVVKDSHDRGIQAAAKLESCGIALQNMKFDLLRLRAGTQTSDHVTSVAERALALARDVDSAIFASDELARLTARPPSADAPRAPADNA